jgi:hypothetical protein
MTSEEFEFLSKQFYALPPEDDEAEDLLDSLEALAELGNTK